MTRIFVILLLTVACNSDPPPQVVVVAPPPLELPTDPCHDRMLVVFETTNVACPHPNHHMTLSGSWRAGPGSIDVYCTCPRDK